MGTRWWPAALIAVRGRDVASSRSAYTHHTHTHTLVTHTHNVFTYYTYIYAHTFTFHAYTTQQTHTCTHTHTCTQTSNVRPHLRLRAVIGDGSGRRRSRNAVGPVGGWVPRETKEEVWEGGRRGEMVRKEGSGRDPARPTGGTGAGAEACIPERRRPVCGTPARSVESRRLRHNPISSSFSDSLRVPPLLACPSSSRPQPLARLAPSLSFARSFAPSTSSPRSPGVRRLCLAERLVSLRHRSSSASLPLLLLLRSFFSPLFSDSFSLRNTRVTACFVARSAWRPVAMSPSRSFSSPLSSSFRAFIPLLPVSF